MLFSSAISMQFCHRRGNAVVSNVKEVMQMHFFQPEIMWGKAVPFNRIFSFCQRFHTTEVGAFSEACQQGFSLVSFLPFNIG